MSKDAGQPRRTPVWVLALLSMMIGFGIPLLLAEIVLRFLPVHGGVFAQPVNAHQPIFHFLPNRTITWSRDWDFSIVNHVRFNNQGFVNDQDYDESDPRPLLAIVGDSYIEALMTPYAETLNGRAAAQLAPSRRAYSFAASGAPLSQYLVWAKEARTRWRADALVIAVISNDFDESLADYKRGPGFHHYVRDAGGNLKLERVDYAPGILRSVVRLSALGRYVIWNLQAIEHAKAWLERQGFVTPAQARDYVGNTSTATDRRRMEGSKAAVQAFLRDLEQDAGWPPGKVAFLVDGIRYPSTDDRVLRSYFVQMREHFIAAAREKGYEALDLDTLFFARHAATGERFEFPTDGHWSGTGHRVASEALFASATLAAFMRRTAAP